MSGRPPGRPSGRSGEAPGEARGEAPGEAPGEAGSRANEFAATTTRSPPSRTTGFISAEMAGRATGFVMTEACAGSAESRAVHPGGGDHGWALHPLRPTAAA